MAKSSKPISMREVAELAGVSIATVSRVINDNGRFSEETRKRVERVIEENGYIAAVEDAAPFAGSEVAGKVVVAGSSSVTPVMEKLSEAYRAVNPNAEIEVQQSDSTAGMTSTIDGVCDIGMASRELKESEIEAGLTPTVIATDGVAVIVSPENPRTGLTSEQVRGIYLGEITNWDEVAE